MVKLLPFSFNKYSSNKTISEIFNSFEKLMDENKWNYEFEKNIENKSFWFKQKDEQNMHKTRFHKVNVRMKEKGEKNDS